MKQALADRADRPDELVASGRQIDMVFRPGQRVLSLRAGKLWHLLVKAAGVDLAANKDHRMALADLYGSGIGHMTLAERIDALRELQTTLIEVRVPSPKVKGRTRVISEAMLARVERDEDDRGDLVWRFGETLRRVFADSEHWAVLSKRAVMAFESRYSLRLYELIALRAPLDHKTAETFTLEDLRARLGVPVGKLVRWQDVKVKALDAAVAEVNQLAGFRVHYETIKTGRAITAVRLIWEEKTAPERKAAKRELDAPRLGRRSRRDGSAETVATGEAPEPDIAFPDGPIRYSAGWQAIAAANLPTPARDMNLVADEFRAWARREGKPLHGPQVTTMFAGFCRLQKPAN
ncbi:MAG: RepB family plasmid replication initiator protein [Oxalobacteraceae bacterium]|nr:MAG: RepB family plasmid replication initiator protein [Oxalobacteraceae bacterium]